MTDEKNSDQKKNLLDQTQINKLKSYNGNPNLKGENQEIVWTPELVEEYVKCSQDIVYFTETYMKIINVDEGLISFNLYPYQKDMLTSFDKYRYNIVTTARQAGKSTTTCAFILWYILFNGEKTVALLANKASTAQEILGRIQLAYQHLPKWLQQGVKEWNKTKFSLENDSRVIAAATSSDAIRGYSINLLFIDEAAFIENWDAFFTSVFPTISSGSESKIILVSTPNGLNHFYKTYINSDLRENKNGYHGIQVHWSDVPGRGEKWKEEILSGMNFDYEKFEQEHCCSFLGSSGTLIAGWKLKELVPLTAIIEREGLIQYFPPDRSRTYVAICDVSRGKGLDYSAFQVIDVTEMPYKQVALFRSNTVTPVDYAEVILRVVKAYNDAATLIEINDIGEQVSHTLHYDFGYENVLFTENAGRNGKQITGGFAGKNVDKGIRTSKMVKALGCSMLKLLIEQNQLVINDFYTISELATFSRKNQSYEAEPGCHDDLVMCLVLFGWLSEQMYFKDLTNINTLQGLRDKTNEDIDGDLAPFGFVDDGRGEYDDSYDHKKFSSESWMFELRTNF